MSKSPEIAETLIWHRRQRLADEIQVVGHVDLTGGAITKFLITQHYSSAFCIPNADRVNP